MKHCKRLFLSLIIVGLVIMNACNPVAAQVNLQTGGTQFNLPLFNIADQKTGMGSSISLNYINGNGLKVDQNATNIGTGWDFILRTVYLAISKKENSPHVSRRGHCG